MISKNNRNILSYKKKTNMIMTALLFIICMISVVYANAAENKEDVRETIAETSYGPSYSQETIRFRMANEDGIPVAMTASGNISLNEREYGILTRIVEAEATGMDKKSKILVANVVLNRMKSEQFPDSVEEVVFQNVNGAVQFSPIADGRYYSVKVTDATRECVDRALAGEDYSEGALYFMERSMSDPSNVSWFDRALTRLFVYQGHEFYR